MTCAILAVQGAFAEHRAHLERLGENCIELRGKEDLEIPFDRIVLPGGESTVQAKLLRDLGMEEPLKKLIKDGMPVLGTCAGLILLSRSIADSGDLNGRDSSIAHMRVAVEPLGTLDAEVSRNAYGRQLGSFHAEVGFTGLGTVPATFIRAPRIESVGEDVEVLAELEGMPVAVRQGNQLAMSFHPELDDNLAIHELFLSM